ncbi:MAG: HAD family phosphatase [Candidatus Pacebacteria bacterium]|nr:HAD family phosphatase [Candidatus Paceibacterota bacterium]
MPVIFDMDGVIADTQKIHSSIESEMLAELFGISITPEEITSRFSGRSLRDQFAELHSDKGMPYTHDPALSDRKAELFMARSADYTPIEGTIARIESLYGRTPLGVASASRPEVVRLVLNTIGVIRRFDALASSKEVERGKPAPDVFLLAAARLGVNPRDCIVVEDGVSGMIGAKAAGMQCVALVTDRNREYPADIVVTDLRDVPLSYFLS